MAKRKRPRMIRSITDIHFGPDGNTKIRKSGKLIPADLTPEQLQPFLFLIQERLRKQAEAEQQASDAKAAESHAKRAPAKRKRRKR